MKIVEILNKNICNSFQSVNLNKFRKYMLNLFEISSHPKFKVLLQITFSDSPAKYLMDLDNFPWYFEPKVHILGLIILKHVTIQNIFDTFYWNIFLKRASRQFSGQSHTLLLLLIYFYFMLYEKWNITYHKFFRTFLRSNFNYYKLV